MADKGAKTTGGAMTRNKEKKGSKESKRSNSVGAVVEDVAGGTEEEGLCEVCAEVVKDSDRGIACNWCNEWYHIGCVGIPLEIYDALQTEGLHWFCKKCNKNFLDVVKTVGKLENKQKKLEIEIAETKRGVEIVQEEMKTGFKLGDEAIEKVENKLRAEMDKLWAKNLELEEKCNLTTRNEGNNNIHITDNKIQPVISRNDILEEIEIDKRKYNLMFMGVEEGGNDINIVTNIVQTLVGEEGKGGIRSCMRVGKLHTGKNRPIKIAISTLELRSELLKNATKLKNTNFNKCYIVPDLTPRQQMEDKKLRDKLKEIREQEGKEAVIKIKKGKIIKNLNGREVILFPPTQLE